MRAYRILRLGGRFAALGLRFCESLLESRYFFPNEFDRLFFHFFPKLLFTIIKNGKKNFFKNLLKMLDKSFLLIYTIIALEGKGEKIFYMRCIDMKYLDIEKISQMIRQLELARDEAKSCADDVTWEANRFLWKTYKDIAYELKEACLALENACDLLEERANMNVDEEA